MLTRVQQVSFILGQMQPLHSLLSYFLRIHFNNRFSTAFPPSHQFFPSGFLDIKLEERKLRVFENMVLRRIFGLRRDEVTGEWKRLHNEELNDLYSSPNIVRVIKWRRMR